MLWNLGHSILGSLLQVYGGSHMQTWFPSLLRPAAQPFLFAVIQDALQFAENVTRFIDTEEGIPGNSRSILLTQVDVLNTEDICSICMEQYMVLKVVRTKCHHIFHETCIQTWMQRSLHCPLCRGVL